MIPLIPIVSAIIAAATAGVGIKKGVNTGKNISETKTVSKKADTCAKEAQTRIENAQETAKEAIQDLGRLKIEVLTTTIYSFVNNFEQIKNVQLEESKGLNELQNLNLTQEELAELRQASLDAKGVAVNGIAAVGSGALLAYGTYSVVMSGLGGLLITATTGTALGTLHGVAAVNATLAWLGGGALSAGGFGMAGGMLVLGGLALGPALAVGGVLLESQSKKALNNAYSNLEKAREFDAQSKIITVALDGISERALQLKSVLENLNLLFSMQVNDLSYIVRNVGTDWSCFSEQEKNVIFGSVKTAQIVKVLLDVRLLNDNGSLNLDTQYALDKSKAFAEEFQTG